MVKRTAVYAPGATIWRVHPAVRGKLVGEHRDTVNRRVAFFALSFPDGKPIWEGLTVEEQWWTGIDRVEGDLLFIHGFVSPDMPMHRGITVVDIPSGKVLWSQPLWTLDVVRGRTLRVLTDGRDYEPQILVDVRTGEEVFAEVLYEDSGSDWWTGVAYPEPRTVEQCGVHAAGAAVLKEWKTENVVGPIETVELPELFIAAAAVQRKHRGTMRLGHELLVVEKKRGKIVHDAVLAQEAKGAVMESCFVQKGMLVYVQEKQQLCLYRL
jgi:hypothetical protein